MAHKSKTQRAKAATKEANRKERQLRDEATAENLARAAADAPEKTPAELKKEQKAAAKAAAAAAKAEEKEKEAKKPKKKRFQFFRDVKAEMKRVTWPTRQDVMQWSGVVVAALVFFGVYVFILDSGIIVNVLTALSNLGA